MYLARFQPSSLPAVLALTAVCSGLCPRPAGAVSIRPGASVEETLQLEDESYREGKKLKGVGSLVWTDWGIGVAGSGTVTYLGPTQDGRSGLLLTAAAVAIGEPGKHPSGRKYDIRFGHRVGEDADYLSLPVTRIIVHPDYGWTPKHPIMLPDGKIVPFHQLHHDLALVEFDLAACGKLLQKRGIKPLSLFDDEGHRNPEPREAQIAGFGHFGLADGGQWEAQHKIHLGSSWVTYGSWYDLPGFRIWAPLKERKAGAADWGKEFQIDFESKESGFSADDDQAPVKFLIHPRQAFPTTGDGGAPLLFRASDGELKVAGVFCHVISQFMVSQATGQVVEVLNQFFEAVPDHLDWVRSVMAGKLGKSIVVTPGEKAERDEGKAAGGVERKTETKSDKTGTQASA